MGDPPEADQRPLPKWPDGAPSWRPADVSAAAEGAVRWLAERYGLTARQSRVLELMIVGRKNGEIAKVLGITVRTVRAHAGAVFKRTGIDGREELPRLIFEVVVHQADPSS